MCTNTQYMCKHCKLNESKVHLCTQTTKFKKKNTKNYTKVSYLTPSKNKSYTEHQSKTEVASVTTTFPLLILFKGHEMPATVTFSACTVSDMMRTHSKNNTMDPNDFIFFLIFFLLFRMYLFNLCAYICECVCIYMVVY